MGFGFYFYVLPLIICFIGMLVLKEPADNKTCAALMYVPFYNLILAVIVVRQWAKESQQEHNPYKKGGTQIQQEHK